MTGKLVVFVPDSGSDDPTIIAELQSNGGRNNVLVQGAWKGWQLQEARAGASTPCRSRASCVIRHVG